MSRPTEPAIETELLAVEPGEVCVECGSLTAEAVVLVTTIAGRLFARRAVWCDDCDADVDAPRAAQP